MQRNPQMANTTEYVLDPPVQDVKESGEQFLLGHNSAPFHFRVLRIRIGDGKFWLVGHYGDHEVFIQFDDVTKVPDMPAVVAKRVKELMLHSRPPRVRKGRKARAWKPGRVAVLSRRTAIKSRYAA